VARAHWGWEEKGASVSQYRRRGGSVDAGSRPALSRRSGSRRSWNERTSSCPMAVQFVAPKLLSQDAWWASGLLLTTAALFRGLKTRAAAPRRPFCVITILMATGRNRAPPRRNQNSPTAGRVGPVLSAGPFASITQPTISVDIGKRAPWQDTLSVVYGSWPSSTRENRYFARTSLSTCSS
jgi:hypothetical protein